MSIFSGSMGAGILTPLRNLVANSWMIRTDGPGLMALLASLEYALIIAVGVPFLMLMLAAIAGNMIQHRLVWSAESLKPKFSKISPGAGFKRVFGKQAVANFLKGLFKLIALGTVMTVVLWPERQQRMKKRMMAAVPKASVIITNPTHYSVALAYDRKMAAPVCVAKGVDNAAFKIREIAKAHDIPIVENVPLARSLYATVDIDEEIPVEHYHAVAEIIGFVMRLKRGFSSR
jgi:flagellar biosynthesis protein FlhB